MRIASPAYPSEIRAHLMWRDVTGGVERCLISTGTGEI